MAFATVARASAPGRVAPWHSLEPGQRVFSLVAREPNCATLLCKADSLWGLAAAECFDPAVVAHAPAVPSSSCRAAGLLLIDAQGPARYAILENADLMWFESKSAHRAGAWPLGALLLSDMARVETDWDADESRWLMRLHRRAVGATSGPGASATQQPSVLFGAVSALDRDQWLGVFQASGLLHVGDDRREVLQARDHGTLARACVAFTNPNALPCALVFSAGRLITNVEPSVSPDLLVGRLDDSVGLFAAQAVVTIAPASLERTAKASFAAAATLSRAAEPRPAVASGAAAAGSAHAGVAAGGGGAAGDLTTREPDLFSVTGAGPVLCGTTSFVLGDVESAALHALLFGTSAAADAAPASHVPAAESRAPAVSATRSSDAASQLASLSMDVRVLATRHSGWLRKCGGSKKTWRLRHCTLALGLLWYAETAAAACQASGFVSAVDYTAVVSPVTGPESEGGAAFALVREGARAFFFEAESPEARRGWLDALAQLGLPVREPGPSEFPPDGWRTDESHRHPPVRWRGLGSPRSLVGILTKRGARRKNWKRRYFVLERGVLRYFASEASTAALGELDLSRYTTVGLSAEVATHGHVGLVLDGPGMRSMLLSSSSVEIRTAWLVAFASHGVAPTVQAVDVSLRAAGQVS